MTKEQVYKIYNLSDEQKNKIVNLLDEFKYHVEKEDFDDACTKYHYINLNFLNRLCFILKEYINNDIVLYTDISVQKIIYDIQHNEYEIEEHVDGCENSYILYLDKDETIKDSFYVEKRKVWNLWKGNKLLRFDSKKHHGKIYGKGKREVLCIFVK